MSPQPVAAAVLLTGRDLDAVVYAVRLAQRQRAQDGQPRSRQLAALADACHAARVADPVAAVGQSDSPAAPVEHHEPEQTTSGQVVGITEAAALLGVSPRTVRRLAPHLDGQLIGGTWMIPREALNEHLEGGTS